MKLKKLKDLEYKVDKHSTTTINYDDTIIKISPIEILTIAEQITRQQTPNTIIGAATNFYTNLLNSLDVPTEIIDTIRNRIQDKNTIPQRRNNAEENKQNKTPEIKKEHKLLYNFVSTFVNKKSKQNDFFIEEFETVGKYTKQDIKNILEQYGFIVEINNDNILISLGE